MASSLGLSGLLGIAFLINLPLGYLRQGTRRLSWQWFFFIHASIPLIVVLRLWLGYSWKLIPFTLGCAVLGQIVGGRLQRRMRR